MVLDVPDRGVVEAVTVSSARLVTATQRYTYDAENDVLIDNATGATCPPEEGNFVCDGQPVEPGWHEFIGFANFRTAVTDPRLRAPLVQVFIWTVVFATLTVTFSLALGMLLAVALNDIGCAGRGCTDRCSYCRTPCPGSSP